MPTLKDVDLAIVTAMKAGDRSRLDALRMLSNTAKTIAKNDGNRAPVDEDLITAGNRMIKQTRETMSFLKDGDPRIAPLLAEISVVEDFLPTKMSRTDLETLIEATLSGAPEGKAARGFVMKELNAKYRGEFDAKEANEILTARL